MASTLPTFTDLLNVTQDVTILTAEVEVQQFTSLATLKAFTPTGYTKTAVVDALGANDNAFLHWSPTSAAVADDATIIQPDAGGVGRWLLIV